MDSTYWYYTLSAIPQTLASVIALSATFVVFKLNAVQQILNANVTSIKALIKAAHPEKTHKEIIDMRPKEMATELDTVIKTLRELPEGTDTMLERMMDQTKAAASKQGKFFLPNKENVFEFLETSNGIFREEDARRDKIQAMLKSSVIITVAPLIGSLLVLPHYGLFAGNAVIPVFFTFLAAASVVYTSWNVWKIATV